MTVQGSKILKAYILFGEKRCSGSNSRVCLHTRLFLRENGRVVTNGLSLLIFVRGLLGLFLCRKQKRKHARIRDLKDRAIDNYVFLLLAHHQILSVIKYHTGICQFLAFRVYANQSITCNRYISCLHRNCKLYQNIVKY